MKKYQTRKEQFTTIKQADGACTNCGGIDHVTKFCYERPRKAPLPKVVLQDNKNSKMNSKKEEVLAQQQLNIPKSKYEEDVHFGQHQSVWGSYWNEVLGWGFKCCFSNIRTQDCAGEKGKRQSLTKEYSIKRQIEETPLVEQQLKTGPVNLSELYLNSNLREGAPVDLVVIGPEPTK